MQGMMARIGIAGGLLAALAGCGSKTVTAENASVNEVAAKVKASGVADETFISPGQWRMTMTVNNLQLPGMPPEMAGRMKAAMGQPRTIENCVTPEEARRPKEGFFSGEAAQSCRYDSFSLGGGKISMVMHCTHGDAKQTVKMDGTYGPEAYHMTMTSNVEGGAGSPAAGMVMNATVDAKRISGVCPPNRPS